MTANSETPQQKQKHESKSKKKEPNRKPPQNDIKFRNTTANSDMLQKKEKKDTTANSKTQPELKSEQVGPY